MIAASAQLEGSLIVERVKAGLRRARADGKRLGRPPLRVEAGGAGRGARFVSPRGGEGAGGEPIEPPPLGAPGSGLFASGRNTSGATVAALPLDSRVSGMPAGSLRILGTHIVSEQETVAQTQG